MYAVKSLVKVRPLIACLIVILFFSQVAKAKESQEKPVVIRFSHVVSPTTPKGLMAEKFKELIESRIGKEQVVVEIFPNSQLYSDSKVLDALLAGNVEIAAPSVSKFRKYSQRFQVFDLPFIFASSQSARNFMTGEYGERLLHSLSPAGFHGFGYLSNGMRQLTANQPVISPHDLNGVRIRYSGSKVAKAWLSSLKSNPQKISFSKVYDSLKSNEIDAQMNTWSNILSKKFHTQQKYLLESNHSFSAYIVLTSSHFWKKIPVRFKRVVEQSIQDAIEYGNDLVESELAQARQEILDSGQVEVFNMSTSQRNDWVTAMLPIWQQFEDEVGRELLKEAAAQR
ncbi:MAG: DctP family TRAP transporter solute-binding subunit [Arenicella sp.]